MRGDRFTIGLGLWGFVPVLHDWRIAGDRRHQCTWRDDGCRGIKPLQHCSPPFGVAPDRRDDEAHVAAVFILSPPTDLQQPVERLPHLLPLPGHCTFEPLDAVPIDVLEDRRFTELPTGLRSGDQCVGLDLPLAEPGTVPVDKPEVGNALNGNSGA